MHRFMAGFAGICVFALASCVSSDIHKNVSFKTALVATEKAVSPLGRYQGPFIRKAKLSAHKPVMPKETAIQSGSIHSHIIPGVAAADASLPFVLSVDGDVEYHPLAGRTIYLDETRDINLAPKEVVLTFDDGPVPGNTHTVLDALDAHGVKGTFFMVGEMAKNHSEVARNVAARGETIGSHTYSHPKLPNLPLKQAVANIDRGVAEVEKATGQTPHFFRFPYLNENKRLDLALQRRGLIPVGIDVDSRDYIEATTSELVDRVMKGLEHKGGGIVLMHDLQGRTARAIEPLLSRLEVEGYKVVRLKYGNPLEQRSASILTGLFEKPSNAS